MSRNRSRQAEQPNSVPTQPPASDGLIIQMKPQRMALVVLLLIFVAWLGLLLSLYFRTRPHSDEDAGPAAARVAMAVMMPGGGEPSG